MKIEETLRIKRPKRNSGKKLSRRKNGKIFFWLPGEAREDNPKEKKTETDIGSKNRETGKRLALRCG